MKYCPSCKNFKPSDEICEDCGTPLLNYSTKACPNCKTKNRIDLHKCIKCGYAFDVEVDMNKAQSTKQEQISPIRCEKCGKDYPSIKSFRTPTICYTCYHFKLSPEEKKAIVEQFPEVESEVEKEEKSTEILKGPLGCISTFIGVLIWGGSAALLSNLGLGGWSILIRLIIALILGPAIDMGLRSITGKK